MGQVSLRKSGETVRADRPGATILRLDEDTTEYMARFGAADRSEHRVIRWAYTMGETICHTSTLDKFVVAFSWMPYIYEYDRKGEEDQHPDRAIYPVDG